MPSTDLAKSAEVDRVDAMEPDTYLIGISLPDTYLIGISLQSSIILTKNVASKGSYMRRHRIIRLPGRMIMFWSGGTLLSSTKGQGQLLA
jgi:hypothetical protein